MELNELPRLSITAVAEGQFIGALDPSPYIGENWVGCVITTEGRFVWGRFVRVDTTANLCTFKPDETDNLSYLEVGRAYPCLDGYWGERAELVLDRQRIWRRARFEPSDAIWFKRTEGERWTSPASNAGTEDGEIVKGGWDHEHCAICWETLGSGGQAEGFLSPPHTWVCETC